MYGDDQGRTCVGTTSKVEETTRGSPGGENGEGERRKHAGRKEEGRKERAANGGRSAGGDDGGGQHRNAAVRWSWPSSDNGPGVLPMKNQAQ